MVACVSAPPPSIPITDLSLADQALFEEPDLKQKITCAKCGYLMLEVKQLQECGHLLCSGCVSELKVCPVRGCNAHVGKVHTDKCVARQIRTYRVRCKMAENGCRWSGNLGELLEHNQICEYQSEHRDKDHWETNFVKGRSAHGPPPSHLMKCIYCEFELEEGQSEDHLKSCEYFPVKCTYCEQDGLKRRELQNHQHYDCAEAEIKCPFADVGCPEVQPLKKKDAWEHKRIASIFHLEFILSYFMSFKSQCNQEFSGCLGKRQRIKDLEGNFEKLEKYVKHFSTRFDEFSSKGISSMIETLNEKIFTLEKSLKERTNKQERDLQLCIQRVDNNDIKIRDIEAMLGCLQEDGLLNRPRGENKSVQDLECRVAKIEDIITKMQKQIEKYDDLTSTHERLSALKDAKIMSLESQLAGEASAESYDGILIWKITHFMEKRHDAIIKKKTYQVSPYFYSGPRGYKMRARIYLNGDGLGKNSFISLFFTVMKGPNDALLPWPFQQKITMMILDQNNVQHAVDSFYPDHTNMSFQRPKSDSNVSSGCPQFLPLESLDRFSYVRDDCMFVKFVVDKLSV